MKKALIIFVISISLFNFYGCTSCACNDEGVSYIPVDVLEKAHAVVASKTGLEFFKNHIRLNQELTVRRPNMYEFHYILTYPGLINYPQKITFMTDTLGNLLSNFAVTGIPDCSSDPVLCEIKVNDSSALEIARKSGMGEGVREPRIELIWNPEYNRHVWEIYSYEQYSQGSQGFRGKGKLFRIDPYSGIVLAKEEWKVL